MAHPLHTYIQQPKDFCAAGFDALIKCWEKCIGVGGGYVKKYQVQISHDLHFILICDLFTDSPLYFKICNDCFLPYPFQFTICDFDI
jgi:hypothetical protein